jgi:hypothetical protein
MSDNAAHQQRINLGLKPWEDPPSYLDPDETDLIIARGPVKTNTEYRAACVLKKLLAAGLSQDEPNPRAALAKTKNKSRP